MILIVRCNGTLVNSDTTSNETNEYPSSRRVFGVIFILYKLKEKFRKLSPTKCGSDENYVH